MAKPWETKAPPTENASQPWKAEFVKKFNGQDYEAQPKKTLKQTMPEGISFADRFKIANFSNDPKTAANWLREKYPDFDVGFVGDQIAMKPKGVPAEFQAIIPEVKVSDIWENPEKVLQRATDFTADVALGVGSGLAAGGAAGLTALSGPGALAAGAAAGGATSAAGEGLRQKIGQALGINEEIKGAPIATAGALGAGGTLLTGAGAAKGAIGKGYDYAAKKIFPKVGEVISGVPAKTISTAAARMPEIKALEKQGVLDFAEKAHEGISGNLNAAKQQIGQNIQQSIEGAGGSVDIAAAAKPFQDLLDKLNKQFAKFKSPEIAQKIKDVEQELKYYFGMGEHVVDDYGNPVTRFTTQVDPSQAFALKKSMAQLGELDKVRDTGIKSGMSAMSPAQQELAAAARQSKSALDKGIGEAVDLAENTTGGMSQLRTQYRDLMNMEDYLEPHFKTPEKTFNTMRNMQGKNKEILLETMGNVDKKYGTNAVQDAELLDAYNTFNNPSFNPLSTKGSTSTGRAVPLAGLGAAVGGTITNKLGMGYMPGLVIGGGAGSTLGSPAALRGYMAVGRGIRNTGNFLGPVSPATAQTGLNVMQNPMFQKSPWTLFPQGEQQ